MSKKRFAALATASATAMMTMVVAFAAPAAAHGSCHNESNDVTLSHIAGVDGPDPDVPPLGEEGNGIYAICIGEPITGVRIDNDGSGYCVSVVVNGTWIGDCSVVVDA